MASVVLNELTGAPVPGAILGYRLKDGQVYLDGVLLMAESDIDPEAREFVAADEDWADYLARRKAAMEWLFGPGKTVAQVEAERKAREAAQ